MKNKLYQYEGELISNNRRINNVEKHHEILRNSLKKVCKEANLMIVLDDPYKVFFPLEDGGESMQIRTTYYLAGKFPKWYFYQTINKVKPTRLKRLSDSYYFFTEMEKEMKTQNNNNEYMKIYDAIDGLSPAQSDYYWHILDVNSQSSCEDMERASVLFNELTDKYPELAYLNETVLGFAYAMFGKYGDEKCLDHLRVTLAS